MQWTAGPRFMEKKMKKCSIIVFIESDAKKLMTQVDRDSYIICGDIGITYALDAGIHPDLVIGDFDSYKGSLPDNTEIIRLPEEKDETDTNYCVNYAIENGFKDITIYGGLGGRFDHSVSNIQTIAGAASKAVKISMVTTDNIVYTVENGTLTLPKTENAYFSVFSMSDVSEGISIQGAKYCVEDFTMTRSYPIGTSNEFKDSNAVISVESGTLLVIVSKK